MRASHFILVSLILGNLAAARADVGNNKQSIEDEKADAPITTEQSVMQIGIVTPIEVDLASLAARKLKPNPGPEIIDFSERLRNAKDRTDEVFAEIQKAYDSGYGLVRPDLCMGGECMVRNSTPHWRAAMEQRRVVMEKPPYWNGTRLLAALTTAALVADAGLRAYNVIVVKKNPGFSPLIRAIVGEGKKGEGLTSSTGDTSSDIPVIVAPYLAR